MLAKLIILAIFYDLQGSDGFVNFSIFRKGNYDRIISIGYHRQIIKLSLIIEADVNENICGQTQLYQQLLHFLFYCNSDTAR